MIRQGRAGLASPYWIIAGGTRIDMDDQLVLPCCPAAMHLLNNDINEFLLDDNDFFYGFIFDHCICLSQRSQGAWDSSISYVLKLVSPPAPYGRSRHSLRP